MTIKKTLTGSMVDDARLKTDWTSFPSYHAIIQALLLNDIPLDAIIAQQELIKEHLARYLYADVTVTDVNFRDCVSRYSVEGGSLGPQPVTTYLHKSILAGCSLSQSASTVTLRRKKDESLRRVEAPSESESDADSQSTARPSIFPAQSSSVHSQALSSFDQTSSLLPDDLPQKRNFPETPEPDFGTRIWSDKLRQFVPAIYLEHTSPLNWIQRDLLDRVGDEFNHCAMPDHGTCQGVVWLLWQPNGYHTLVPAEFHVATGFPADMLLNSKAMQDVELFRRSEESQHGRAKLHHAVTTPLLDNRMKLHDPPTPGRTISPPRIRGCKERSRSGSPRNKSRFAASTRFRATLVPFKTSKRKVGLKSLLVLAEIQTINPKILRKGSRKQPRPQRPFRVSKHSL